MPVYGYYYPRYKKEFELKRPVSEFNQPAVCSQCGSMAQKMLSGSPPRPARTFNRPGYPFGERKLVDR